MKIHIDTSKVKHVRLTFHDGKKEEHVEATIDRSQAQAVLPLIDLALQQRGKTLSDIEEVSVVTKGESYTGIRVGVAIANVLAFTLHIPVNHQKLKTFVEPSYT